MGNELFLVDWECCLGAGGEGEVFLARSLKTWELFALKVSTYLDREEAKKQLSSELERCSRVAGEGVVGLVAWNLDCPRPFLVFEFAHAGTLADEMRELRAQGKVYHPVKALERIREVLVSLGQVHERGLVHRDVKPSNLLRFGKAIKFTDFGTGRSLERPMAFQTQSFVGTRMYAAPEQVSGGVVDERADLYAVGCILHEMLTGHVPKPYNTRVLSDSYPNALVIPEVHQLLRGLLSDDKSFRPFNADDAVRRVDNALQSYSAARRVWKQLRLGPSPY